MNENRQNGYWSDYARVLANKQRETDDYKKLLFILSMSVIGVTVIVQAAAFCIAMLLPVFPGHPDWAFFISKLDIGSSAIEAEDLAYLFMWLANDIAVYIPPLLVYGLIFRNRFEHREPVAPYVFKGFWVIPFFLAGIAIATGSSILTTLITDLFSGFSGGEDVLPDVFRDVMPENNAQLLIMFLTVGIIAPICEEIIYRHILLKPLRRFGDLQAVIITSVLFGFFHGNLTQLLYAAMVGIILGIAAVRANSVVPAIIIHMLNNVFVVFSSHLTAMSQRGETALGETALGVLNITILLLGVAALVIMAVNNMLSVFNYNPYISQEERVKIICRRPSVFAMAAFLLLITILGSLV